MVRSAKIAKVCPQFVISGCAWGQWYLFSHMWIIKNKMVPTWKFSSNAGSSNGENWRLSKHQYNFPSKCGSAISSSVNHSLTILHLCQNLLSWCSYSISSQAVFSLAFLLVWLPAGLWDWEQRIFLFHLLYSLLRIAFLDPTLSLRSGIICPGSLSWLT